MLVTYGRITSEAIDAVDRLKQRGEDILLLSLNQIKPIADGVFDILLDKKSIFFFEEGIRSGGIGEKLGSALLERGYCGKYRIKAIEDKFVQQASVSELLSAYGLDCEAMIKITGEG